VITNILSEDFLPIIFKNMNLIHKLNLEGINIKIVIVVISNRSLADKLEEFVSKQKFKDFVSIVFVPKRVNLATGRNIGINLCKDSKFIAFIDDDLLLTRQWILNTLDVFRKNDNIVALTGNAIPVVLRSIKGQIILKYLLPREFFWLIGCPYFSELETSVSMFYIDTLIGSNMIFRREVFEKIGAFNEKLGFITLKGKKILIGGEDTEISQRIIRENLGKLACSKRMIAFHIIGKKKIALTALLKRAFWYPLSYMYVQRSLLSSKRKENSFMLRHKKFARNLIKKILLLIKGSVSKPSNIVLLFGIALFSIAVLIGHFLSKLLL